MIEKYTKDYNLSSQAYRKVPKKAENVMNKIKKGRKQWLVTDTGYVNKEYAKK